MNVTQADIDALSAEWLRLSEEANAYFERVWQIIIREAGGIEILERAGRFTVTREAMAAGDNGAVAALTNNIAKLVIKLIDTSKASPVVNDVDRVDLRN